jgi:hypothetical protein
MAFKLRLDPLGRALLSTDHGRLYATLTVLKSSPAPSQAHTEKVQLVPETAGKEQRRGPKRAQLSFRQRGAHYRRAAP